MNINKIRCRRHQFSYKTPHQKALCMISDIMNSIGLPTKKPKEPITTLNIKTILELK